MADNDNYKKTVVTSELRLYDNNLAKMSLTFGNVEQDGEQAYLNIKYKISGNDDVVNYIIKNMRRFNIVGPEQLTFNDYKVWNETNDGPNSGLNADLLDGRHATEFKDRYGYHHFLHQIKPSTSASKHWVKIATFTTRKIGDNPNLDFNVKGEPAFGGIFQYSGNGVNGVSSDDVVIPGGNIQAVQKAFAVENIREQFKVNTPDKLDLYDPDVFHTTSLLTEGTYNGALRGTVNILKNNNPTTFDFHIGLFEDPLCSDEDGWTAVHKHFYISLHDETLPFLTDDAITNPNDNTNLNKGYIDGTNVNEDTDDKNHETKVAGIVQNGYNVGSNTNFPNFPYYYWEHNFSGGVLTYNNKDMIDSDINSGASIPNAMASDVSFVPADSSKAKAIRRLQREYGADAETAFKESVKRLKDLGLAMAMDDEDDDGSSDSSVGNMDIGQTGVDLSEFEDAVKDGKKNRVKLKKKIKNEYQDYEKTGEPGETSPVEHHNGPVSRIHLGDYNKSKTGNTPYTTGNYKMPPATEQDAEPYATTRRRKPFPERNKNGEGDSYQTYIDIMRLYHVKSRTDTIDGLKVVTHVFELYMAVDEKMEVRIQPYMSSACLLFNFQPILQEADLPQAKFIRPKSIYDNRYASVRHRHYDYERRIWELTLEADQIWKNFKRYLTIDQGMDNKNKVMLTDSQGKIYAAEDNMVRHCEPTVPNPDTGEEARRTGGRVLITSKPAEHTIENASSPIQSSCVDESSITIDELYTLKGIKGNIQEQLDNLWKGIDDIWNNIGDIWDALNKLKDLLVKFMEAGLGNFVKIPGDTMTGGLWMDLSNESTYEADKGRTGGIPAFGFVNGNRIAYTYGGTADCDIGWAIGPRAGDWCIKWNKSQFGINGTTICFGDVNEKTGEYENGKTYHINLDKLYEMMEDNGYSNKDENK